MVHHKDDIIINNMINARKALRFNLNKHAGK